MAREHWLQISGAAFIAFFLVTFDNVPLVKLLHRPSYYRDVAITFLEAFLLFSYIGLVTRRLDGWLNWQPHPLHRIGTQAAFGVIGAVGFAYGMAYIQYNWIDSEHVFGTESFLQIEFPVIVLFIFFINTLYSGISYYQWLEKTRTGKPTPNSKETSFATLLIGIQGHKKINIPVNAIGLISVENGLTWVFTFDNRRYHLDEPLQQLMQRLDPDKFFRANRQNIVQLAACYAYHSTDFGKIKLMLVPPFGLELIISQKTAPTFRKWIER
jgi:LytTr DNA-binding domain